MEHIVILTGAGISAESGINTFRDNNGLWENHRIEEVATPEAFISNPELVYHFYNLRRQQLHQASLKPNAAHYALAKLHNNWKGKVTLITQNVDNLHERAGISDVIHMHGELLSARCTVSGRRSEWLNDLDRLNQCECCQPASALRPDIVWFGEMPLQMELIYDAVQSASVFVAIGTSGQVYPAAGLVDIAHQHGAETHFINLESTDNPAFEHQHIGAASSTVPKWVEQCLERQ
ncbi:NAD-dependent protein deacylase [Alteromonas sediminis]|uniref:NAD-dependent protein deacylase n=1 Tax=Alteromonas sediminis TaxID=2259342 RepID=A0A3N5Y1C2_9ALTE|nr:Sir2 family NAD+-dependent deacetylase [Alteromonas sediminis]RPJ67412.1 NAD-dependent protein deacylase [Alteromonas sediminis]